MHLAMYETRYKYQIQTLLDPLTGAHTTASAIYHEKGIHNTQKALSNWANTLRWGNKKRAHPQGEGEGATTHDTHIPPQIKPTHTAKGPRAMIRT